MIAILGPQTLLNTAKGGLITTFVPSPDDLTLVATLNTNLLGRLPTYTEPFCTLGAIQKYVAEIQAYTAANPELTNTSTTPITDEGRLYIARSALPAQIRGHTIVVTVGSDLTTDIMTSLCPWYKGVFHSGNFAIETLNSIARDEAGVGGPAVWSHVNQKYGQLQLSFDDFFHWPKKSEEARDAALTLLRSYLQAIRPLSALTFSRTVAKHAQANFHKAPGPKISLIVHIGHLTLSQYGDDDNDEDWCLDIPCIHPGLVNKAVYRGIYTSRVIHLVLAIVWVAMDGAMSLCHNNGLSSKQICLRIQQRVLAKKGPLTPFGEAFKKAKDEFRALVVQSFIMRKRDTENDENPPLMPMDSHLDPLPLPASLFAGRQNPLLDATRPMRVRIWVAEERAKLPS